MKFLEVLLALVSTHGKSFLRDNTEALSLQVVNYARRVAVLLSLTVISIVLFCSGFSMAYAALIGGYERLEGWVWSPGVIGGLILAAASAAGLVYGLGERRWLAAAELDKAPAGEESGPSPMETAIAALLLELANELKNRREHPPAAAPEAEQRSS